MMKISAIFITHLTSNPLLSFIKKIILGVLHVLGAGSIMVSKKIAKINDRAIMVQTL